MGSIPGNECFLLILLPASLFDLLRYKVPNALFVSALLISLIRRLEVQGFQGICPWLTGIFIPFFLSFIFYKLRMLGASDIKMFSAIGSFVGSRCILEIMFFSLIAGAILAIFKMSLRRNFIRRFLKLYQYVTYLLQDKKIRPYYDRRLEGEDGIIPFTVAITIAFLFCVY